MYVCMYVCNRGTQFCVTAGSTLIFKSVQSRELGQSPLCCTGGAQHHVPRAHNVRSIPYPYMKVTATYSYVAGCNRYNGCCCVPGPVSKLAIFGSRKNRTNCVTDHTKGLLNETLLLSSLHSWLIACLTPLKFLQEDHKCSGSSRAVLQNRHR